MTVEKLKGFEPLFGSWTVVSKIAEGRYSKVFKVAKADDGQVRHQCLKTIRFPSGNDELSKVISSGIYTNVQQYLDEVEASVRKNMDKMLSLRSNKNIVRFDNYTIIKENSCFYLVILMELLKPLNDYLKADSAVQNDVIRIGTDICSALEGFRAAGIIHHEIKPENVYVDARGNFKLGDFGVCKGRFGEDKVVSSYIAPELYGNGAIDISSDIYSLGILLYKLLNNNRQPFLPQYPAPVSLSDREYAFDRRMRGDLFPAPSNASQGLSAVIFKATAFKAHERYRDPAEFSLELEKNYIFAPPEVPVAAPIYAPAAPITPVAPSAPAYSLADSGVPLYGNEQNAYDDDNYDERDEFENAFADYDDDGQEGEKVNKKWYFIIIALVIVLAVAIGFVVNGSKEKETTTTTTTQAVTFGSESTTFPTTTATTTTTTTAPSTTESTTESTTASTSVITTVDAPSAVTTTNNPNTTKATLPSTTESSTALSTTEPSTEPPVSDPNLIYNQYVEGAEDEQGRVYTEASASVTSAFSGRDAIIKIDGLSGSEYDINENLVYVYMLGGETPRRYSTSVNLNKGTDGSVSCFVTVDDESFTYNPEAFRYYVLFEEGAIVSDSSINLGVQIKM